jgi:hypothetical protein
VASIEVRWPFIGTYRQLRTISGDGQVGGAARPEFGDRRLEGLGGVTGATIRTAFGLRSDWFIPTNPRFVGSYPRCQR